MDKRAALYTAADRPPTNQVSAWQAERQSRENSREDVERVGKDVTRMLQGCYEKTVSVECKLSQLPGTAIKKVSADADRPALDRSNIAPYTKLDAGCRQQVTVVSWQLTVSGHVHHPQVLSITDRRLSLVCDTGGR